MLAAQGNRRVWLYIEPTDMRKSFNGLSALVKHQLSEDPLSGHYFVFINRRGSQMKILYFDRSGYAIWSKRLEQGRFVTRPQRGKKQSLSFAELQCLLEGIEIRQARQYKRYSLPNQRPDGHANRYNDSHA